MVKVKKEVDERVCDECKEHATYHCDSCGADYCFDHGYKEKMIVDYNHGVFFGGSGDLNLCVKCDTTPPPRIIPVVRAFRAVADLRREYEEWHRNFKVREKQIEENAAEEMGKFKKKA
jgi:hypothetical protein